jgi:hypothetical protein
LIDAVYRVGPRVISWADLEAWSKATGINLTGWESELIKKLCDFYDQCALEFSDKDIPAPYQPEESRKNLSSNIQNILRRPVI